MKDKRARMKLIWECCEKYNIAPEDLVNVYEQHLKRIVDNLPLLFDSKGVELVAAERKRQIEVEGWTKEHDAIHFKGELAIAASCYALHDTDAKVTNRNTFHLNGWPWDIIWWKPSIDKIKNLVKAGALIVAEIDREIERRKTPPATT